MEIKKKKPLKKCSSTFSEFGENYKPTHVLRSTYLKYDKDKPDQETS